ncbi:MAG: protein kinase [Vicinamibacterales bacterium]
MELTAGRRLGSYEVLGMLGSGGMGEVYRAKDSRLSREVALKVLPVAVSADPETRARFEREARVLATLNHPNIVTVHAVEDCDGRQVIAMELVAGRSLDDLIPAHGLPLARVLGLGVQIAAAVTAAHRREIVHRDLKPANVMVGPQDHVKVLDFGLAKFHEAQSGSADTTAAGEDLTGPGRVMGTVSYMSPEQAEGRPVDERTDVFSLGVVLYEMACGERPFKGDTSLSVLSAILRDTPRPITEIKPAVPRDLVRILRRCLAKNADERYQSAGDLRNDLEDLLQSMSSGALDAVAPVRAAPSWHGWKGAAAGVFLAAAASAGWMMARAPAVTTAPTPSLTFSRLTLLPGVSREPMISPDGKWVVYVSDASGNPDIYLQSTTGLTPINLTTDSTVADRMPAFSPDGESIAFRSERDGGGLFVMGRTGESVRRLTRTGYQPAWFPDGRQIAFVSRLVDQAEGRGGEVSELWAADLAGGAPRQIYGGDALQPAVSPNGLRIAFWGLPTDPGQQRFLSGNRDLWSVAADGSDPRRLTDDLATEWNPVWSPDGQWLYFLSSQSGSMNLRRVAVDPATGTPTGRSEPMTTPALYIRQFSLSSDGRLGAYATWNATYNLKQVAFDPELARVRGPVQPLTTGPRDFGQLDVSPDGKLVVLASSNRGQEDLFVVAADGSALRHLTNDRYRDRNPRWAPDGRRIVFYSDRGGVGYELWSIDHDGSDLKQLTQTGGQRYFPVPNRDGAFLAAADLAEEDLFVYDGRDFGKAPLQLPEFPRELRGPGGSLLAPLDWSPDGSQLAGVSGAAAGWVYSFAETAFRRAAINLTARWLPDGRRLLFQEGGRLLVTDWRSGDVRPVLALAGEDIATAQLTRDGKTLFFLSGSVSGDVWMARFEEALPPRPRE